MGSSLFKKIMNIPKEKLGDQKYMLVGMLKKSVQGDGKRNDYNCINKGVISRTMCVTSM
jgi:hypothetical protein